MSTLRWADEGLLAPRQHDDLFGPRAPFELTEDSVFGATVPVFAQRPRRLGELLPEAAERFGDHPFCVVADDPAATITFADMPGRVAQVAAMLRDAHGLHRGDRLAIASANRLAVVLTEWAALTLGVVVVQLNGWWTAAELAYGIELTAPALVVGDAPRVARLRDGIPGLDMPVVDGDELIDRAVAHGAATGPDDEVDEDDPALVLFTSGTTGRPKGATLTHRNLIHAGWMGMLGRTVAATIGARPPSGGGVMLCTLPFFHTSGTAALLHAGPLTGTTLVLPAPGRWDPGAYLALTEQYGLTNWSGVPTQYWRILEHPDCERADLTTVRNITSGGAPFPPELMRRLRARIPGVNLTSGYGATEITGGATSITGEIFATHPGASGRPWPTLELEVRDDADRPIADGDVGQICVRGATVFRGYWKDPEATAAALAPGGWYRTGDYGRIEDGLLYVESRRTDLIVRGGENVYPAEIEHRLVEHPDVARAAVVGVDDREWGQVPRAYVVVRADATLSSAEVQEWVGATLARFKVPSSVEFRDELPYTETGKVMKHLLQEPTLER